MLTHCFYWRSHGWAADTAFSLQPFLARPSLTSGLEIISVQLNDQELVSRAQRGDATAFEELVHRYDRQVLAIATSYTNDPDESQDIYQEVFLRVYRSISGFKYKSEFSTWLFRIVTNVCLSHQMRARKYKFMPLESDLDGEVHLSDEYSRTSRPVSPEQHARNVEIAMHVEDALERLAPQQRLVFTLKHYQGYKLREIAEMMGCAEGTVKKYLFTATDKLRKRLKKIF